MSTTSLESGPATLDRIRQYLVGLKMPRALEALEHILRRLERGELSALEAIDALLGEELTLREGRRIKAALKMGRLLSIKTLTGFDFSFQPSLDRDRIMTLAQLDFVDRHEVVHFLGQPGCGKTHLALALGVEAVKAGRSVYFATLADIVSSLAKAEREGTLRERLRFLCRPQLLIVDEIGYLPVIPGGGNLFFQLVNARYERGAMILTSNRGFSEWGDVFGGTVVASALLDRLLHHAVVVQIEGASYRLRRHAELMPDNNRSRPITAPPPAPRRRGRPPKARSADTEANPWPFKPSGDFSTDRSGETSFGLYSQRWCANSGCERGPIPFRRSDRLPPFQSFGWPGGLAADALGAGQPVQAVAAAAGHLHGATAGHPSPPHAGAADAAAGPSNGMAASRSTAAGR